ncbi:hypothetical protein AB3Y40_06830 [Yoonia sp. R2331]|uniref:hypothetical protein n=1 Tax=Yoonia sp. R2331 TaxID=3237238 RepID=UPI0034E44A65
MADQLWPGILPVQDANGNSVANGYLVYYETGTTTLISIWSNEAGTVPHPNGGTLATSVRLNAGGSAPQVFYTGTLGVKCVIYDDNDVEVYTLDPIPRFSSENPTASEVTATANANNAGVTVQAQLDNNSAAIAAMVGATLGSQFSFESYGGATSNTGAQNSAALTSAIDDLKDTGGSILFGAGTYTFDPVVLSKTTRRVGLIGAGSNATFFEPANYDQASRSFMMTFGDQDNVSTLTFHGFTINSPGGARHEFHGVHVHPTNNLIVNDIIIKKCDGQGARFDRSHNSWFNELQSNDCGSATDDINSVLFTGTLGTYAGTDGAVMNDAHILGTTEDDYLGWRIENAAIVRGSSHIKVHGGNNTTTGLELHRVKSFDAKVTATNSYSNPDLIKVSDSSSAITQRVLVPTAATTNTVRLDVTAQSNLNYTGGGSGGVIGIYQDASPSRAIITGLVSGMTNGKAVIARSPGNNGAIVDVTGLRFGNVDVADRFLDERTSTRKRTTEVAASPALRIETDILQTSGATRGVGELIGIDAPADATGPGGFMLAATTSTTAFSGSKIVTPFVQTNIVNGTINATTRMILASFLPIVEDQQATLFRLSVSAQGVVGYDATDRWEVDIYKGTSVEQTLILANDRTYATNGAGYAQRSVGGLATTGVMYDFWGDTLSGTTYNSSNITAVTVRKEGAAADLTDLQVTAQWALAQ